MNKISRCKTNGFSSIIRRVSLQSHLFLESILIKGSFPCISLSNKLSFDSSIIQFSSFYCCLMFLLCGAAELFNFFLREDETFTLEYSALNYSFLNLMNSSCYLSYFIKFQCSSEIISESFRLGCLSSFALPKFLPALL